MYIKLFQFNVKYWRKLDLFYQTSYDKSALGFNSSSCMAFPLEMKIVLTLLIPFVANCVSQLFSYTYDLDLLRP